MDAKRLVTGTVVGAVAMWALGWVIFTLALGSYYDSTALNPDVIRGTQVLWAQIAGGAALAALVTLCLGWSGATSPGQAFKTAGIVGCLVWLGVDLILFSFLELNAMPQPFVDAAAEFVRTGLVGVVIALVLAKVSGGE